MYYTLEKAAEVLGVTPGDLNRLREAGKIRAFRDGNTWKFRKEDVDNHLTEVIKSRSSDSLDSDLLNDSDEELPTILADSNSFESLAGTADGFKISAREPEDDVFIDESTQSGDGNVLEADEPRPIGSSGISLFDDEDDIQLDSGGGSDSGISLIDDGFAPSSSNVDLGAEDIVLGGSNTGSDSGLSLMDDDGLTLESVPGSGPEGLDPGDGSGISLLDENEPFSLSPDLNMDLGEEEKSTEMAGASAPVADQGKDASLDEIFELDSVASDEADTASDNETYDLVAEKTDSQPSTTTRELNLVDTEDEDFQLDPLETHATESDSDSSSQVIALEDDSLFQTEDESVTDGHSDATAAVIPDDIENADPFGGDANSLDDAHAGEFGGGFDAGGGFNEGGFGETGFNDGEVMPIRDDGGLPPTSNTEFPQTAVPLGTLPTDSASCPYTEGKGCMVEPNYSGMAVGLGLVPCILVLILAGIGVYELVRVIWSWDQPFALTGSILETIGGLLKLF